MFCDYGYQLKGKKINGKSIDAMEADILTFILIIHKYQSGKILNEVYNECNIYIL